MQPIVVGPSSADCKDEQIIGVLKGGEARLAVKEICRKQGICNQTYYRWKAKYSRLEAYKARRLRSLEEENRRLKVAAATGRAGVGHSDFEGGAGKKALTPAVRREALGVMQEGFERSERRSPQRAEIARSSYRY